MISAIERLDQIFDGLSKLHDMVAQALCSRPRCGAQALPFCGECWDHVAEPPRDGDLPPLPFPHAYVLADTWAEAA